MPLGLLLMLQTDPAAVLDRMRATLAKPLTAEFTVVRKDVPGQGSGKITVERPCRMRYVVKWGPYDFESTWSEDRTLELTRAGKTFYESGPYERLYQPQSAFSTLPDVAFPLILLIGDPRQMLPEGKLTYVASEKVGGAICDHVKASGYDAWVSSEGKLLKFRYDAPIDGGTVSVTYQFTNFKTIAPQSKSFYEPGVPAGFRPYGLPRDPYPLQPGYPFPDRDWSASVFDGDKPLLAVVVSGDCEVSARAARALATLQRDVPVKLFSDDGAPGALRAFPVIKDRSGRTLSRFFTPGTPLFVLVGKDRRIRHLWYGFESEREDEFIRDVRAELRTGG